QEESEQGGQGKFRLGQHGTGPRAAGGVSQAALCRAAGPGKGPRRVSPCTGSRGAFSWGRCGHAEGFAMPRGVYRLGVGLALVALAFQLTEALLRRPVGRPSHKPKVFYHSFRYQAGSWERARRVVAKVEWHAGELFPLVGFIVTNLKWRSKKVVRFYNRRGTAEQGIKEGKHAVKGTRLACLQFKDSAARLQLFALAYTLANAPRQLALPRSIRSGNLTTLREKLVKIGAKVVAHAKYVVLQLAEVAVPRQLFAGIRER